MKKYANHIAVIIPCYNESKTIASVIKEYQAAIPNAGIFVIDNNSTDHTGEIASQNGATVLYEKKQGKGNAVKCAFKSIDSQCYFLVDGDGTYPADKAQEMCNMILNQEAAMVTGDRLSSSYFSENKKILNSFGNRLVRKLINLIYHTNIKDVMTGSRALSSEFVESLPEISDGFEIETEFTLHALNNGWKITEIVIPYKDRPEGSISKIHVFSDGFKILKTIAKLRLKKNTKNE